MLDGTKCVGYARVSTTDQNSATQIGLLRKEGVNIIFSDDGISGKRPALSRGEFREMIKYLKSHPEVKTIVTFEISRIGRDFQDSINTFLNLEKDGYVIWSLSEEWTHHTNPTFRKLLLGIFSWMNDGELVRLSKRVKAGMEHAKTHGTKSGKPIGKPPKEPNKEVVATLREQGKTWKEISSIFRIEPMTLYRYTRKWKAQELGRVQPTQS